MCLGGTCHNASTIMVHFLNTSKDAPAPDLYIRMQANVYFKSYLFDGKTVRDLVQEENGMDESQKCLVTAYFNDKSTDLSKATRE